MSLGLFDSHCHFDDPAFDADRPGLLRAARAQGVTTILVPGVRPATFARVAALAGAAAAERPRIVIALGVHPQVAPDLAPAEWRALDGLPHLLEERAAVAVGECGLDGPTGQPEVQEALFARQIGMARALRLPLILHVLRAHEPALRILARERAHEVGGVVHSFSGSAALVPRYRDLGFSFSFAGPVGYPGARRPVEAARAVPDDLLLVETDAPDQTPAEHRGERNQPAYLTRVLAALAAARGQALETLAALTRENAQRVFRLPPA